MPATPVIDPEVMPSDAPVGAAPSRGVATVPTMGFNLGTTVRSPFFWIVIGAVSVIAYYEVVRSRERGNKKSFF